MLEVTGGNVRNKIFELTSALLIFLVTASAIAAQEVPQNIQVHSSILNIRHIGFGTMDNTLNRNAAASVPRQSAGNSPFAKMHPRAHEWGRILAQNASASAAEQQVRLPAATPLPIVGADASFRGFAALTGRNQASVSGFDLEPPDQGLCTDGTFVMEAVNVAGSVYDATSHKMLSGPVYLNDFFGVDPQDFTSDPRCYYDPPTQRWFVTMTDLGLPTGPSVSDLLVAISQSSDPRGTYNLYAFDTTNDGFISACPCFGDQPLIGADTNGFYISTNAFGATEFGGAQIYALSKYALVLGIAPFGVHITPLPASGGFPFPFSVHPALSPEGQGDSANGGTEYFLSAYNISSTENNMVSVWAMTNTDTLNAEVGIPGFTAVAVSTESYVVPIVASQKPGPIPLGKSLGQPEGTLNPDDQRMQIVTYADGSLWSSLSTAVQVGDHILDGAAYFVIKPTWKDNTLHASVSMQGYVATENNHLLYPAIGVSENGNGAMVFTLTGPDYFPSAAYIPLSPKGRAADIRLAARGVLPDDGFTCYPPDGPPGRWGDYSWAVTANNSVWIATEYIGPKQRDQLTNWGTFIGSLPLP
jgi:hypothetical protein